MNRIDRLNAILIHLQSKPRTTVDELEDKYELSRRTIFRDIRSLIDAGVPIGGDAGEGYFIVEGYHLPPVVFNKEEAAAILVGAKLVPQNADMETAKSIEQALVKVKAVLRYSDKEYLDKLEQKITILQPPNIEKEGFPKSHLGVIQQAISTNHVLEIQYYASYNDATTSRQIEPLGLVFYANRWHVIAYCRMRKALRDFRADRVQKPQLHAEVFDPKTHPDYLDFLKESLSGIERNEAIVQFHSKVARFIDDQKFHYGLAEEKRVGEWVEMKFYTPSYDSFSRWLMSFTEMVNVIAPFELKHALQQNIQKLVDHHQLIASPKKE
ncbi:MAG: YafY family transcriptional regulator [Cyclobacteriaceae bacterium]